LDWLWRWVVAFFLGEANTGVFKAYTKNHISMHLHGYGKVTPSDFSASFQGRRLKFGTLLHIIEGGSRAFICLLTSKFLIISQGY